MIGRRHSCRAIVQTAAINRCIVELQANNRFRLKIYRLSQIYIYIYIVQLNGISCTLSDISFQLSDISFLWPRYHRLQTCTVEASSKAGEVNSQISIVFGENNESLFSLDVRNKFTKHTQYIS